MPDAPDMTVRIGFSTPYRWNPLSWLIRRVTRAECSHCWFLYWDRDLDVEMVADAHETGFRTIPYDVFRRQNRIVRVIRPAVDLQPGFKRLVPLWIGRANYDVAGLLTAGLLAILAKWLHRTFKNPLRSSRQVMCSEAIIRVMQDVQHPGIMDLDPESAAPQVVLDRCQRLGLCDRDHEIEIMRSRS